jgi:hypothetical protein
VDSDTLSIVMAALFAVSEALSLIPRVRANGVFQAVYNVIRFLAGRKEIK